MSRRVASRSFLVAGLTAAGTILLALGAATATSQPAFQATMAAGVTARMTAVDLQSATADEFQVMAQIGSGSTARISSAIAVRAKDLRGQIPSAPIEEGAGVDTDRVLWVVNATGTFATNRGRQAGPLVFKAGALIVDDATGEVVGVSMH